MSLGLAIVLSTPPVAAQLEPPGSATETITLSFDGRTRQYLLHVPASADGALVLAFHGGGLSGAQQQVTSGLDKIADREKFIVAYPEGFERGWADGRGVLPADKQGIDDVGFARAVVADISRRHKIDRARVFATGLSNGGLLVSRLVCGAADTFAAVAPVIGTLAVGPAASCRPSAPVAVIGIQGIADPTVPFEGGYIAGGPDGGSVLGSRATQELFRSLNGCTATPVVSSLPVIVKDGTSVDRRTYGSCRQGADVVWYEIQGGGHRWPPFQFASLREAAEVRDNGVSSQNLVASEVIWEFFAAHARR
jgi:polyhydroxybutyrate depolymerase